MTVEEAISIVSGTAEGYVDEIMYDEALKVILSSAEKQIPKKPIGDLDSVPHYRCPVCFDSVKLYDNGKECDFCPNCGQKIDWSEDDDS